MMVTSNVQYLTLTPHKITFQDFKITRFQLVTSIYFDRKKRISKCIFREKKGKGGGVFEVYERRGKV